MVVARYIYQKSTQTFVKMPNYIYPKKNGCFEIRKRIDKVLTYWGTFHSLEEAELWRAYYIGKHWNVNPSFRGRQYIIKAKGGYFVAKIINGKREYFGFFKDFKEAEHERDICLACNWDINRIVEFDEYDYCWLDQPIEA